MALQILYVGIFDLNEVKMELSITLSDLFCLSNDLQKSLKASSSVFNSMFYSSSVYILDRKVISSTSKGYYKNKLTKLFIL